VGLLTTKVAISTQAIIRLHVIRVMRLVLVCGSRFGSFLAGNMLSLLRGYDKNDYSMAYPKGEA